MSGGPYGYFVYNLSNRGRSSTRYIYFWGALDFFSHSHALILNGIYDQNAHTAEPCNCCHISKIKRYPRFLSTSSAKQSDIFMCNSLLCLYVMHADNAIHIPANNFVLFH